MNQPKPLADYAMSALVKASTNPTMTSKQIALVVDKRHDNVKRTIEALANQGVISYPQIEDGIKAGNGVVEKLYLVNERDSYVVVAQLCPEYTAKLVDYWMVTKNQAPVLPTNYIEALEHLLIAKKSEQQAIAERDQLQQQVIEYAPQVEALRTLANSTGFETIDQAAHALGVAPRKTLRPWMIENKWIYQDKQGLWRAYAHRVEQGVLAEKDRTYSSKSGNQKHTVTVYVTPKGKTLMATRLQSNGIAK